MNKTSVVVPAKKSGRKAVQKRFFTFSEALLEGSKAYKTCLWNLSTAKGPAMPHAYAANRLKPGFFAYTHSACSLFSNSALSNLAVEFCFFETNHYQKNYALLISSLNHRGSLPTKTPHKYIPRYDKVCSYTSSGPLTQQQLIPWLLEQRHKATKERNLLLTLFNDPAATKVKESSAIICACPR